MGLLYRFATGDAPPTITYMIAHSQRLAAQAPVYTAMRFTMLETCTACHTPRKREPEVQRSIY